MDVGIEETRQQHMIGGVDGLLTDQVAANGNDALLLDEHVGRVEPAIPEHLPIFEHRGCHTYLR